MIFRRRDRIVPSKLDVALVAARKYPDVGIIEYQDKAELFVPHELRDAVLAPDAGEGEV